MPIWGHIPPKLKRYCPQKWLGYQNVYEKAANKGSDTSLMGGPESMAKMAKKQNGCPEDRVQFPRAHTAQVLLAKRLEANSRKCAVMI